MPHEILRRVCEVLALPAAASDRVVFTTGSVLPSAFKVSELAASTIAAACLAVSELIGTAQPQARPLEVDVRRASIWFGWSIAPIGWSLAPWDAIAGDYRSADGWIRLHTNAPHHRRVALQVLQCAEDRGTVANAVATWRSEDLESAIVAAGGCAAEMRSVEAWSAHPQGRAVSREPLIAFGPTVPLAEPAWRPDPARPLAGIKVLDRTRVLAGPVATRFLAGYGADVLRIDPPWWEEPAVVPEVTLGKRCARLDLHQPRDRVRFETLLAEADILVHGYRADALAGLGYGEAHRRAINPGLIDVSLNAYGWTGPWQTRRGFDSLVQMSAGIAASGMAWKRADRPTPLPVQALDHATGYLMAAAAIRGLIARTRGQGGATARLSLARTAKLLIDAGTAAAEGPAWSDPAAADFGDAIEQTVWGPARRCLPPASIAGAPMVWRRPPSPLGSAPPSWTP